MSVIDTLRGPKLAGFVLFDWVSTIIGSYFLARAIGADFVLTLIILLLVSIVLHDVFDVNTRTNKYLGLNRGPIISEGAPDQNVSFPPK